MKGGSLRKEQYGFFAELSDRYCMERLNFCALIKHIFKIDLPNDVLKTSFLSICKPTCRPEIYNKKEIALVSKSGLSTFI